MSLGAAPSLCGVLATAWGRPRRLLVRADLHAATLPRAPLQAEARQQQWAGSAAGRAAIKSVKAVQEERHQGRPAGNDNIKDWLT